MTVPALGVDVKEDIVVEKEVGIDVELRAPVKEAVKLLEGVLNTFCMVSEVSFQGLLEDGGQLDEVITEGVQL